MPYFSRPRLDLLGSKNGLTDILPVFAVSANDTIE
jgi:hypothetical protein